MQISIVKLIFLLPSDLISGGGKSLGRIALVAPLPLLEENQSLNVAK